MHRLLSIGFGLGQRTCLFAVFEMAAGFFICISLIRWICRKKGMTDFLLPEHRLTLTQVKYGIDSTGKTSCIPVCLAT